MKQLTEKTFFYYLKCPKWVSRDVVHGQNLDALEDRLLDDGLLPEVMEGLLSSRGEYAVVEDEDVDDAFSRTVELMKSGAQTIYRGVLLDGHWVGRPDVLEKVEGTSDFGDYYYVAVDIKRINDPRGMREGHKLQGAFYAELLEKLQGTKPTSGYIMSPQGVVMRYDLEAFEADYRLTLDRIEKILGGEEVGHVLTSGCKMSPFFPVCVDEMMDCDDISLINRIKYEELDDLKDAGIETVMDLATADFDELLGRLMSITEDRLEFLHRQAVSLKERIHDVVAEVELPDSGIELYFDIEADSVRDVDYMFGVLKVDKTGDEVVETMHTFIAEKPEDEEKAWNEFTNFLAENSYYPVYHYGWYEISVCAKLIDRYGAPEGAIKSWEENFVDLYSKLRPAIIFPLSFYSLKDIAQYIGFEWRGEDAGGVNSIRWYHDWLDKGDRSILERIVQYNEDDVRATRILKEWLVKQKPKHD